jgi:D-aminoacyl-tRNA deacylase
VQRVASARVRVGDDVVGEMDAGLLALVGVARGDTLDDARRLADKLANLRLFDDASGRMNRSLLEAGGTLGVVSQFTLLGDARKGRRPSYHAAAPPEDAEPLVGALVESVRGLGVAVITGRFRTEMRVELANDGPVTLLLDTRGEF